MRASRAGSQWNEMCNPWNSTGKSPSWVILIKLQGTNEAFNETIRLSLVPAMLVYHSKNYKGIVIRWYILSCIPSVLPRSTPLLNPVTNFAGFEKQITNRSSDFVSAGGESWHLPEFLPCHTALGWPVPPNIKNWKCFLKLLKDCAYLQVDWRLWRHRAPFPQPRCEFCQAHKKNRLH